MRGLRFGFVMFCCGLAAALVQAAPPASVQGIVTKVIDGDSLWLTPPGKPPIEVRLRDIDAPESCQPWGPEARKALADLALNKVATLQVGGRDSYGRTLGTLLVEELQVNRFLVENGHAWSLRSRWDQGPLVKQERMARALTRGLHALPGAVQPWEFRRTQGPCPAAEAQAGAPAVREAQAALPPVLKAQAAAPPAREAQTASPPARVSPAAVVSGSPFRCDGRTHCSQMSSCAEARFFLANCPGVKMDGNRDGVPCEKQHCR